MVTMPVVRRLEIQDYGLFPGDSPGAGIDQLFAPGPTVIVGINGLGKTTLLTAILRCLTGPFDLSGDGIVGEMGVSLPRRPIPLKRKARSFFKQRVSDGARNAVVRVTASLGHVEVRVSRRMSDLSLVDLTVDREPIVSGGTKAARESRYQEALAGLMGLGSFVDVLLILHHVVLFPEERPGALWDKNAQRHVLRALFLDHGDASRMAELERLVQSKDSQARNIHTQISATEKELQSVRKAEAASDSVAAQLLVEQELLDAELAEKERLQARLMELQEQRQFARLEHEKAKLAREEAAGAEEEIRFEALGRLYPNMHDASRLVLTRLMTDEKCLVCDARAHSKREELENLLAQGVCPACGALPERQAHGGLSYRFERARLDRARERLRIASEELETKGESLTRVSGEYREVLEGLVSLQGAIRDRRERNQGLEVRLSDAGRVGQLEQALVVLHRQHEERQAERAGHVDELTTLLQQKLDSVRSQASSVRGHFAELGSQLLAEEVRLAEVRLEPRYTQADSAVGGRRLEFPAYEAEMVAAERPGHVRRAEPADVSESQRELIDLAFRLALMRVASPANGSTFIMETPEASLDAVAMKRVGRALVAFAAFRENRLIVTSNLSNSGLVSSLLGGATDSETEREPHRARVLNLLEVAAPNRALDLHRAAYERVLQEVLAGTPEGREG